MGAAGAGTAEHRRNSSRRPIDSSDKMTAQDREGAPEGRLGRVLIGGALSSGKLRAVLVLMAALRLKRGDIEETSIALLYLSLSLSFSVLSFF